MAQAGDKVDLEDNVFMLPGPVKLHPRVLRVMSLPVMAHRSKDFSQVHSEIRELLKYLFQSDNDVAIISGSGTASWTKPESHRRPCRPNPGHFFVS